MNGNNPINNDEGISSPSNPSPRLGATSASPATAPKPGSLPAAPPVPPVQPPNPLAHLPLPAEGVDFALRGVHAEVTVVPSQVVFAAEQMDAAGFALDTITGVDWLAQGQMEIVYDFFHPLRHLRAAIRARVPRDKAELPTISKIFPGANWHERETHDFFGIQFAGHPDLTPFLLPEDADYHPLRKDFGA